MKKLNQTIILSALILIIVLFTKQYVLANSAINVDDFLKKVEFSDNYDKWIELSETEKQTTIQPRFYDDLNTPFEISNPFYEISLVGASLKNKYSLKDTIANNVAIKNQYDTQTCWAFAGLSSLETNLALNDYKNGTNQGKVYDFSERHANYATSRTFLNGEINKFGFNRTPDTGGQWLLLESYLTNGQGAINESAMPFENNSDLIDISKIQNKEVQTRVYDTIYFNNYNDLNDSQRTDEMNEIKQHIQEYGSVFATIHGNSSDVDAFSCYNNTTGAKYCNNPIGHGIDHAVSIIGWDDSYSVNNFAEGTKPSSNGAWIVRNSWGEKFEYDLAEFKQTLFDTYPNECRANRLE